MTYRSVVILFACILLTCCSASFLSTFDPEQLNIKVRRSSSAAGIVGESVQLVKDHFIRKNVLDAKQWNQIIRDSNTCNSTIQAMTMLIEKLGDPYSRYFGKPSMALRYSKFKGVSVSAGITIARRLRLSNIRNSIRRSWAHNVSMREKVKMVTPLFGVALTSLLTAQQVILRDPRMVVIPAAISVALTGFYLQPHALLVEVVSVENLVSKGIEVGDHIVAVDGCEVRGLSLRKVQKLLNLGDCGDPVQITVAKAVPSTLGPAQSIPSPQPQPNKVLSALGALHRRQHGLLGALNNRKNTNIAPVPPVPVAAARTKQSTANAAWNEVNVELTRQYVPAPSTLLNHTLPGCGSGVGYISIGEFSDQTFHDVNNAIQELRARISAAQNTSLRALVFDLRGNPGGPIVPALDIAALFLSKGKVLTQLASHGRTVKYHSTNRQPDLTTALLLLVDARTASASEILVEALCDNGRATSMGCRTVGKNVAQAVLSLSDGSGLCFTVREYFTPSGRFMGNGHSPKLPVEGFVDISRLRFSANSSEWNVF